MLSLSLSLSLFSLSIWSRICFKDEMFLIKTLHVPKHLLNWSIAFVQINYKHDLYSTHDFDWYGYKGLTRFQMMFSNKNRKHFCYSFLIKINYFVGRSLWATALNKTCLSTLTYTLYDLKNCWRIWREQTDDGLGWNLQKTVLKKCVDHWKLTMSVGHEFLLA